MPEELPSRFPNLVGKVGSARAGFYNEFQREADEYDRDFTKKYEEYMSTTLIFVSLSPAFILAIMLIYFFRGNRLACSPQLHLLSFLMFRRSLNRITKK